MGRCVDSMDGWIMDGWMDGDISLKGKLGVCYYPGEVEIKGLSGRWIGEM